MSRNLKTPGGGAPYRVLCVAGSDSAGCAGAVADVRTVAALGGHPLLAITAVTAQDTSALRVASAVAPRLVREQIGAVLDDCGAGAVKIGMLATAPVARAVASALAGRRQGNIVLDPVLRSTTGGRLLDTAGRRVLVERLIPLATLLTPNIPEAETLLGRAVRGVAGMTAAARALQRLGARAVLVKGGHGRGATVADVLADADGILVLRARRVPGASPRGTGCILSTAIACHLARGLALRDAVRAGERFVAAAIAKSYRLGAGRGPADPTAAGPALCRGRERCA